MNVLSVALLPARAAMASAEVDVAAVCFVGPSGPLRRPGGYSERLEVLLAEDGGIEELGRLGDRDGPLARLEQLATLTGDDRPLGRALAPGGPLDRLLAEEGAVDRLVSENGPLDRLLYADGPLDRLLAEGGALDRLTAPGGPLERLLEEGGILDRLVAERGLVERVLAQDGAIER